MPSISSAVTQLLASYDQQAVQDALPVRATLPDESQGGTTRLTPLLLVPNLGGLMRAWLPPLFPKGQQMMN